MKILFVDEMTTGCYFVRTKVYADELRKLGHDVLVVDGKNAPENILDYDIICFNRLAEGDLELTFEYLKGHGKIISYDTDDAINLVEPTNMVYYHIKEHLKSYYYIINESNIITTTTPLLGNEISSHTPQPIYVFPNCIVPEQWKKRAGGNVIPRIGFAGSNSHIADIVPALDGIIKLQEERDFEFVLFGFSPSHDTWQDWINDNYNAIKNPAYPIYKAFIELEKRLKQIKNLKWEKAVSVFDYQNRLSELNFDIGIAPILDTPFNRSKSELKLLEYAMVGTPTVAINIPPYLGTPAIQIENNPHKWYTKLMYCLDNPEYIKVKWQEQYDWVLENRDIAIWGKKRAELYESLLNGKSGI